MAHAGISRFHFVELPFAGTDKLHDGPDVSSRNVHFKMLKRLVPFSVDLFADDFRLADYPTIEKLAAYLASQRPSDDFSPDGGEPTRVGFRFLEDGRKVRYAKRSGEVMD